MVVSVTRYVVGNPATGKFCGRTGNCSSKHEIVMVDDVKDATICATEGEAQTLFDGVRGWFAPEIVPLTIANAS